METREAIFGRRSIRKYLDKPIEPEVLQDILEGAVMAPSAVNNQPWYFLAIQSQEQMEKLRGIFQEVSVKTRAVLEKRFPNNPEVVSETLGFLTGLGNARVCVLVFLLKPSKDYDIIAVESTSAAIQNLCLMAYDKGIGSCWMTAPLSTGFSDILEKTFAPGKGKFIAAVTLGYPAVSPQAPKRKPGRYEII
ncbi:nitroreductase family protein [Syntrophomonas wolfei]|jgi:nitroreductase|uniref:nitroreductase family protein n=1 Tax=Syntrophomonas wolfei TaxID=863 RepID=UPI000773D9EA|nr:nitroreductase family protein [Syntrophomonas wolfei]